MSGWHLLTLAALCCAALSCGRDTRADDEAAIRAATREWNAADAAKDVDKCVSFYAEDGERFATGSPLIRGTDGLRKEWRKYVSSPGTFHWNTSRVEVSKSGDLAYETGKFVLKTVDKSGQPSTTNGKSCASGNSRGTESGKSWPTSIIPTVSCRAHGPDRAPPGTWRARSPHRRSYDASSSLYGGQVVLRRYIGSSLSARRADIQLKLNAFFRSAQG
jgi:ketosteroid isomerase-like protein